MTRAASALALIFYRFSCGRPTTSEIDEPENHAPTRFSVQEFGAVPDAGVDDTENILKALENVQDGEARSPLVIFSFSAGQKTAFSQA